MEAGGGAAFPAGSRVMFTGPYGVAENGTYGQWLAVRKEHLCLIPDGIEDVSAAGVPVAYLTAQIALSAPAIGGSVGNVVTQLARAQGAKHAMSSTTSRAKAAQAKALGFDEVVDLSAETLRDGVRQITEGYGADIVIDAIGGEILSAALSTLAPAEASPRSAIRPAAWDEAWQSIGPLLRSGAVKPIVARTFPLAEAAEALRYLIEDRPFGRVVLTI